MDINSKKKEGSKNLKSANSRVNNTTMEEPLKEQASASGVSEKSARPKLQRYALRSATKSTQEKTDASSDLSNSAASKRGRPISSVSKSVGVFDLSGKEKSASAKPPRRLSIPAKPASTPGPKVAGNITPISETRSRRSGYGYGQVKSETPSSDAASSRKKFNTLASASFWLSQIKVSESVANHSISLGFFKLALEAGCEPQHLKRMQDELKSYVQRHQLAELEEPVKELFERYNISENTEQLQVSESVSQVPEEEATTKLSSDDDVQNSCSTMSTGNLKPKCLNIDSSTLSPETEPTKKETSQKGNPKSKGRSSFSKNSVNSRSGSESGTRRSVKKPEKSSPLSPSLAEDKQGNKENMDACPAEEISLTQAV
ncbi:muscle M-line assembly protein unc-89-like isoform X1 [Senna tora]|uniref:Muscle M-line assembly protein unc-89-like isoform X1 n=1 Tax=Senna tora TaxID=362788 RepID=A0A834X5R0_9FABA|nr:muscle M-line assembly protein unc-89-like isoform X1 [Senna tora]